MVKAKPGAPARAEREGSVDGRVVKTSPRYGKLTAAQVKRAVTRVTRDQGQG